MRVTALSVPLWLFAGSPAAAPPTPGTVDVMLIHRAAGDPPFADAVAQALGDLAFTPMPLPDHGRYIAEVRVTREQRGVVLSRVPNERPSAHVGNWGGGVAVPLGTRKTQLRDLSMITLTVRLVTRADHRLVWTGSAVTVAVDQPDTAARLARAAVATFPITLEATASVP